MAKRSKKLCFVISPIGEKKSAVRKQANAVLNKIIKPATKKCGYEVIRADMISSPGLITSQIIRHLIEVPLVIADLTGHNPNVFYELAFRHVLKKPVVQIIKKRQKIPFDVSVLRTIFYDYRDKKSITACKKELVKQIRSVENNPTEVDAPFSPTIFPDTKFYKTDGEINKYMLEVISSGSTLDIVSNHLHWVSRNKRIKSTLITRAKNGIEINIYLPKQNKVAKELKEKSIGIHVCPDLDESPHARFTLIDKNNPGLAKLAIGSGRIPRFMISEFSESANAQVVAMARDYVKVLGES